MEYFKNSCMYHNMTEYISIILSAINNSINLDELLLLYQKYQSFKYKK